MNKCLNCSKELEHTKGKKKKKYCNDICKVQYWNKMHVGHVKKYVQMKTYEKLLSQIAENNKPENKKRILEERNTVNDWAAKHNNELSKIVNQPLSVDECIPEIDNSEIEKQIADVKKLVKPDGMNQKVWEFDQNKRLKELKSKLK